jgi:cyclopropane fatty-acyl-phospholipid synthase-like methyltransferase
LQVSLTTDYIGMDGNYVNRESLLIDKKKFIPIDLETDFSLDRIFDLVISLEIAEHLSKNSSRQFIENLTKLGDVVLFSAAIPGQGGTNHINEAFPDFWISLFESNGFYPIDVVRKQIWDDKEIDFWYRQNILIFARHSIKNDNLIFNKNQSSINDTLPYFYDRIHQELYMIYVNEKAKLLSENTLLLKKSQLFKIFINRIISESKTDLKLFIKLHIPFLVKFKKRFTHNLSVQKN